MNEVTHLELAVLYAKEAEISEDSVEPWETAIGLATLSLAQSQIAIAQSLDDIVRGGIQVEIVNKDAISVMTFTNSS